MSKAHDIKIICQKAKAAGSVPIDKEFSHEWLANAHFNKDDAVIVTNKHGIVTSMNKVAEEVTGWSLKESTGKPINSIFDAMNERTKLPMKNPVTEAIEDNKIVWLANHTVLIKKDKTQRYIVDSAVPIRNNNSEVIGGALVFMDITQQVLSRNKLTESESLLKGIMEHTSLIIYIKDLEGKYLLINRQQEKIYNIEASNLIGTNSLQHLTMEQAATDRKTDAKAIRQKRVIEYEEVIWHLDGMAHYYHTSKFPLYDSENKVCAVCAISTDITESKKNIEMKEKLAMQEVIMKSEIQYDELTRNMPNMFFSLDRNYLCTSFNKACEKFTGKTAEQVIGRMVDESFSGEGAALLNEYREVMQTGQPKNFTATIKYHAHSYIFIVNIYPTEKGISVLMTDLTKQKKSEMETLELVERLQETNKDLRQFAYTVSHDLRAPIARVLGLSSLSLSDPDIKINDMSIMQLITNEINNLDGVVRDMNANISARDRENLIKYVSFETELKLIKKILEKEIVESKALITFDFKHSEGLVTVKSYLYSIMFNLLSNAIKYRRPSLPLNIHLETCVSGKFVCLSVKDNGMGIDMSKNRDKIFGLYNRFHGDKIEGRGIGLNLVKAQVESLGGKTKVESEVNVGSTFMIYLPINQNLHATRQ